MARLEANSLGMGNLPLVVLPHPIGTLAAPLAQAAVDAELTRIVAAIRTPFPVTR